MDYKALGKNIRKERRNQNLTQEHLAEQVNISSVFLSQIETANKIPSLETVWKISTALHIPLDNLLNENTEIPSNVHLDLLIKDRTQKEKQFVINVVKEILANIKEDELF